MKNLFTSLLAVALLALAVNTQAQTTTVIGTYQDGVGFMAPAIAVSNVFAYSGTLDVRKTDYVSINTLVGFDAAGTNAVFNWVGSTDGVTYDTNNILFSAVCTYTAAGMNQTLTNHQTKGISYLKLFSVGPNDDADSDWTNVVIKYSYKIENK